MFPPVPYLDPPGLSLYLGRPRREDMRRAWIMLLDLSAGAQCDLTGGHSGNYPVLAPKTPDISSANLQPAATQLPSLICGPFTLIVLV